MTDNGAETQRRSGANEEWSLAVAGLGIGIGLLGLAAWQIVSPYLYLYSGPLLDTSHSLLVGFGLAGAALGVLALSLWALRGFGR